MAKPYRTIITLCDEIYEAISIAGVDAKLRVTSRHFGEHRSKMSRAKGKWCSNPQAAAKITCG